MLEREVVDRETDVDEWYPYLLLSWKAGKREVPKTDFRQVYESMQLGSVRRVEKS